LHPCQPGVPSIEIHASILRISASVQILSRTDRGFTPRIASLGDLRGQSSGTDPDLPRSARVFETQSPSPRGTRNSTTSALAGPGATHDAERASHPRRRGRHLTMSDRPAKPAAEPRRCPTHDRSFDESDSWLLAWPQRPEKFGPAYRSWSSAAASAGDARRFRHSCVAPGRQVLRVVEFSSAAWLGRPAFQYAPLAGRSGGLSPELGTKISQAWAMRA